MSELPRLSSYERKLIEAAETRVWGPVLESSLRNACIMRGVVPKNHDNCGDLADTLRLAAKHEF
jgi:hypothetical protein